MNELNPKVYTVRVPFLGKILMSLSKLTRVIAALSILGIACMSASAQLTLDDFKSGPYTKSLGSAQPPDIRFTELAPGSLLGSWRETVFAVSALPLSPPPPL